MPPMLRHIEVHLKHGLGGNICRLVERARLVGEKFHLQL